MENLSTVEAVNMLACIAMMFFLDCKLNQVEKYRMLQEFYGLLI